MGPKRHVTNLLCFEVPYIPAVVCLQRGSDVKRVISSPHCFVVISSSC